MSHDRSTIDLPGQSPYGRSDSVHQFDVSRGLVVSDARTQFVSVKCVLLLRRSGGGVQTGIWICLS